MKSEEGLRWRRKRCFTLWQGLSVLVALKTSLGRTDFCLQSCLSQTAVQIVPCWSPPEGICSLFRWHVTCALMRLTRDESWLFRRGRFRALAVAGQSLGMFTRPDGGMTLAQGRVAQQLLRVSDGKLGFEVGSTLNNRGIWKDQNANPTLNRMRSSSGAKACVLV